MGRSIRNVYFDEYEAMEIISETRLSTIYKARSPYSSGELFAIKVIGVTFANPAEILKKEANILKDLQGCPYIVKSRGFRKTEDGIPYLIMGYVDGIHPLIVPSTENSKPRVWPGLVRTYVRHIAEAIQFAHDKKICHCDIRPENILIEQTEQGNRAILCDFGLAVQEEDSSYHYKDERDEPDNELTLNKRYLSPERYGKDPLIDPAGDQYSLALVVFECLCGEMPAVSGNPSVKQHLINEKYSPEIGDVLEKAMSTRIADRYPTVIGFADELIKKLDEHIAKNQSQSSPSKSKPTTAETISAAASPDLLTPSRSLEETHQNQLPLWIISRRAVLAAALPAAVFLPMTWVKLWPRLFQPPPRSSIRFGTPIGAYLGHRGSVNALAWSPDSQWIASASADNTLQVWKPNSENERIVFPCPDGNVTDVAWSAYKNTSLIAFCAGRYIYIWDFINGTLPHRIYPAPGNIKSLAWSPQLLNSSPSLAIAGDHGLVQVLQFDGNDLGQPPTSASYTASDIKPNTQLSDVAWSTDANNFAVCSKSTSPYVWTWNFNNGLQQTPLMPGLRSGVLSIAWSPESVDTLAVGHEGNDPYVQIWSNVFEDGNQPINYHYSGLSRGIDQIAWSPAGLSLTAKTYIAAGAEADGIICVWNIEKKLVPDTYDGHRLSFIDSQRFNNTSIDIKALAWSPDGTMIASGGTDSTILVWTSGIGTF